MAREACSCVLSLPSCQCAVTAVVQQSVSSEFARCLRSHLLVRPTLSGGTVPFSPVRVARHVMKKLVTGIFSQSPSAGVTVEWVCFWSSSCSLSAGVCSSSHSICTHLPHAPDLGTVSTKSQSIPSYWCADNRSTHSTHPQRQGSIQGTRRGHSSFSTGSWHSSSSNVRLRCFVTCCAGGPAALLLGCTPLGPFQTSRGTGGAWSDFRSSSPRSEHAAA